MPHSTWSTAALWRQILPVVSVSNLLSAISWAHHDIAAVGLDVGLSPLEVQGPGIIFCLAISAIHRSAPAPSGQRWRIKTAPHLKIRRWAEAKPINKAWHSRERFLNNGVTFKVYRAAAPASLFVTIPEKFSLCPGHLEPPAFRYTKHHQLNFIHVLSLKVYSIIGSRSGFSVNLGSDSLGKSMTLGVSNVSRIHFGFKFIVNPDPIIEYAL